jgi:hypothetical protein
MRAVLGLTLSLAALLSGFVAALFVLAAMTGCDLRIRSNMVAFVGCMGIIGALVLAAVWAAWRIAMR